MQGFAEREAARNVETFAKKLGDKVAANKSGKGESQQSAQSKATAMGMIKMAERETLEDAKRRCKLYNNEPGA